MILRVFNHLSLLAHLLQYFKCFYFQLLLLFKCPIFLIFNFPTLTLCLFHVYLYFSLLQSSLHLLALVLG